MRHLTANNNYKHWNIERSLYIFITVCIIPLLLVVLYSGINSRQKELDFSNHLLHMLTNDLGHLELSVVKQSKTLLKALALTPEVQNFDLAKCTVLFEHIVKDNPELANISLVDKKGITQVSAIPDTREANYSDSVSFIDAIRLKKFSTGVYTANHFLDTPTFHFSLPITRDDGEVTGILILAQDLTKFSQYFSTVSLPPGSRITLSDRNGVILIDHSWQNEPTRAGQHITPDNWAKIINSEHDSGSIFTKRYDGAMAYIHYKILRLAPGDHPFMVLNTSTPRGVLLAKADRALWTNLALLTLAATLALALARVLGRRMVGRHIELLRKSEQEFRLLAEAMPQIVWVCTPDGLNRYFNQQWVEYTGLSLEESYGHGWNKPFHPDDRQKAWDAWQNAVNCNAVYALECRLRKADGAYKWWLIRAEPVRDDKGAIYTWFGTCTDIDDLKRTEEALSQAQKEAQTASKTKSEFLANMSHEIRTPLNGILGMLQLLQTTPQDDEQKEYVLAAIRSSKRLTSLLSDILDLSRVEAGKMRIHEELFEIESLQDAAFDLFAMAAKDKGLIFGFELDDRLPRAIIGDEARVRQILFNLIGNSVKFTQHGSVRVEAKLLLIDQQRLCRVLFTVCDTGPGITDEQLLTIFDPFVQGENTYVRQHQGAGLGLSIVSRLVALLGGEAAIESEEGVGTTFYLSIPFSVPSGHVTQPMVSKPMNIPLMKWRILLAEDDSVTRLTIKRLLEKAGHIVIVAVDGAEAVRVLEQEQVDLILMDIQMPVMDGVEATREIRFKDRFEAIRDIPIIALTAYAMEGDRDTFLEAGMNEYISKPVDISTLMTTIARVMGKTTAES